MSHAANIIERLAQLREKFPDHQISKLPKGTKAQNECKPDQKIRCALCGQRHHPDVIHLDYVGHAALTDRLLDVDPLWTWEPFALTPEGLPAFDATGGLWIRLTVCGHTRVGYGNAEKSSFKTAGDREKEVIGDALRNAAMRFGAALDLWHKGTLRDDEGDDAPPPSPNPKPPPPKSTPKPPDPKDNGQFLKDNPKLKAKVEAMIGEAGLNRDFFKQWLFSVDAIGLVNDTPSMNTMRTERAKGMVDKWDVTVAAYNKWMKKQQGVSE